MSKNEMKNMYIAMMEAMEEVETKKNKKGNDNKKPNETKKGKWGNLNYEVVENIATLSKGKWNKELNVVKWDTNEPRLDIRCWDASHTKCGKGSTLTLDEAEALVKALNKYIKAQKKASK